MFEGPFSCVSASAPEFVPGVVWPVGVHTECNVEPQLHSVSVSGEVMGCAATGLEHFNPSPSGASFDAHPSLCVIDKVVAFQDLDYDYDFVTKDLPPQSGKLEQFADIDLDGLIKPNPEERIKSCEYKNYDVRTVLFKRTSPLGQDIVVYPECTTGECNCIYLIGNIECQLKPCRFASLIYTVFAGRENEFEQLLWHVTDGFPIVDCDVSPYECENYSSITCPENVIKMDSIIAKELSEGMISISVDKPCCVHSLGAVPKSNGGMRPITDCSRPLGKSVNNFCDTLIDEFCFKNVGTVVDMLSEGDYMTVVDIKSAYRAVPIREDHRKFQGFSWVLDGEKRWFVDNRLCFGLRLGPKYFNFLSNFVYEVLSVKFGLQVVNYLDDFIAISKNLESCLHAQNCMISTLRFLGFHVSFDKVLGPSRTIVYLGIIIDSDRMELRLPEGKLSKLIVMLDKYLSCNRISKKELESLGGLLSHCSHVVKGGKIFCKSVYEAYKALIKAGARYIVIPDAVKSDLRWWRKLCGYFNGSSKISKDVYPQPMVSDSSFKGFGVYLGEDWAAGVWHDTDHIPLSTECGHIVFRPVFDLTTYDNINELELWPIVVGLKRWALSLKNQSVYVFTDNTQVMYMLINGGSSNSTCKKWIKEIFWVCAIYNIDLLPRYINTKSNLVADTLSRLPYFANADQIKHNLLGSCLCCLNILFENFQIRESAT